MSSSRPGLVVGFDLDMTLIDTVPGFTATLEALGRELGVDVPGGRAGQSTSARRST